MCAEIASSPEALFWEGLPESYLSRFQRPQGATNNCGPYAVAAAISLLRNGQMVDYDQVVALADRWVALSLAGIYRLVMGRNLRLWPGGPTTPRQQANLAKQIGRLHDLDLFAYMRTGTADDLIACLRQSDRLALVTVGWSDSSRPRIVYPTGSLRRFAPVDDLYVLKQRIKAPFAAHVMVLAAYDPARSIQSGDETISVPWGFINSWTDGMDPKIPGHGRLYWMPDADFRAAWGYNIWVGKNKMVIITRRPSAA